MTGIFRDLEKVDSADSDAIRQAYSTLGMHSAECRRLGELIGHPAELEVKGIHVIRQASALPDSLVMVLLTLDGSYGALCMNVDLVHRLVRSSSRENGNPKIDEAYLPGPVLPAEEGIFLYAVACALADVFNGIARKPGIPGMVEGFGRFCDVAGHERFVALDVVLDSPTVRGDALLLIPSSFDMGEIIEARKSKYPPSPATPVTVSVTAGEFTLESACIAELAPGDLVCGEIGCRTNEKGETSGSVMLKSGSWKHAAALTAGRRLCLEDRKKGEDASMQDEADTVHAKVENTSGVAVNLDELPVDVVVELGRITITAGELSSLGPGSVIETDMPVGNHAEIRSAGRLLATGELVDAGGRVGVRIVKVCG